MTASRSVPTAGPNRLRAACPARELARADARGEPTASTLVCSDAVCQTDAANWVYELVGALGTFYPISERGEHR